LACAKASSILPPTPRCILATASVSTEATMLRALLLLIVRPTLCALVVAQVAAADKEEGATEKATADRSVETQLTQPTNETSFMTPVVIWN
jgi:H+/gluconate symporter-like permease